MKILATTYRGEVKDLFTYGTIVLMDSDHNIVYEQGDGSEIAYPRSSAKLIQALLPLSLGAVERFGLTNAEISQMCASHSGEEIHINTVRQILAKIGFDESYLKCGAHYPYKKDITENMIREGLKPTNIHNNCSGKHSGMLASTILLGSPAETYYLPENEIQKKITHLISTVCDYPEEKIQISIDGCGVPVHALPIEAYAYGMARMADYEKLPEFLQGPAQKVTESIFENPIYTSGSDRLDYHVMLRSTEKIIVKTGANGYFAGYLPERKQGFALKCYQSENVYKERILVAFLKKLGIIAPRDYDFFDELVDYKIYNHKKEVVGHIETNLD